MWGSLSIFFYSLLGSFKYKQKNQVERLWIKYLYVKFEKNDIKYTYKVSMKYLNYTLWNVRFENSQRWVG